MSHLSPDEPGGAFDSYCEDPPVLVLAEPNAGDRSSSGARFEKQLAHSREAPGHARRSISGWLASELSEYELDTMRLLTTELITNAVLHGEGEIILKAHLHDGRALVEVLDQGNGFESTVLRRCPGDPPGLGLTIVDTEATRWGIQNPPTRVWFELELTTSGIATNTKHSATAPMRDQRP